jgi:hypothetical protein
MHAEYWIVLPKSVDNEAVGVGIREKVVHLVPIVYNHSIGSDHFPA